MTPTDDFGVSLGRNRRSRRLLLTTDTLLAAIAALAIIGLSKR